MYSNTDMQAALAHAETPGEIFSGVEHLFSVIPSFLNALAYVYFKELFIRPSEKHFDADDFSTHTSDRIFA